MKGTMGSIASIDLKMVQKSKRAIIVYDIGEKTHLEFKLQDNSITDSYIEDSEHKT
jgi:hypothetical protein